MACRLHDAILKGANDMANYYATWRSNYFKVKDIEKFKADMALIPGLRVLERPNGLAAVVQEDSGDGAGIPQFLCIDGKDAEIDMCEELAKHLTDDSVAILMEVGSEKLRYLVGVALAVNSSGEVLQVSLGDIYKIVADQFGTAEFTCCEY